MKKPSIQNLLHQWKLLAKWCAAYIEEDPRNWGTYRGGQLREIYKPLRDGVVFYSSGHGWRLRSDWEQVLAEKQKELQAEYNKLAAWLKGESASNTGLHTDSGGTRLELIRMINSLGNIIVDSAGKGYISTNDLDFANECLDKVIPLLSAAAGKA